MGMPSTRASVAPYLRRSTPVRTARTSPRRCAGRHFFLFSFLISRSTPTANAEDPWSIRKAPNDTPHPRPSPDATFRSDPALRRSPSACAPKGSPNAADLHALLVQHQDDVPVEQAVAVPLELGGHVVPDDLDPHAPEILGRSVDLF